MALKPVGCRGDVQATAGSGLPSTAGSGSWTAGNVSYKLYDALTVGNVPVAHGASCTFSFSGSDKSGNSLVTDSSTVQLAAGSTVLQGGTENVLREGDEASDSSGNKLKAATSRKLHSG